MSCNYADGLSPYLNKGKLGLPEISDTAEAVMEKVRILADWLKASQHTVVHTGAGCSTSAGIPDFRGPKGVWTLEKKGLKPDVNISFDSAIPTPAHMALKTFLNAGFIKHVITQNIDGLHLRSGITRTQLSELHGNMFVAKCSYCERYIALSHSLPTVGQKQIGMSCPIPKPGGRACRGKLQDTLLDWEDALPENELQTAETHSKLADLSICLGTTLQIVPAGNLPLAARKNDGKLVIVNLQATKHDKKADLIIREKIDVVMEMITKLIGVEIPAYTTNVDPTKTLPPSGYLDWTIPGTYVANLKQLLVQQKLGHQYSAGTKRKQTHTKSGLPEQASESTSAPTKTQKVTNPLAESASDDISST